VIIFDGKGKRQINVDLKDIQQQTYPESLYERAVQDCPLVSLCNINFSRPLLRKARLARKLIATDVHTISDLNDDYNRDFMRYADILFMSHEMLPAPPEEWAKTVQGQYGNAIIVIGLGGDGVLLAVRKEGFIGCCQHDWSRGRIVFSISSFLCENKRSIYRDPQGNGVRIVQSWRDGGSGWISNRRSD
jgi:ribokinase